MRGPLALPTPWVRHPDSLMGGRARSAFNASVQDAIALVMRHAPDAMRGVRVAVADVPVVSKRHDGVPLAESMAATPSAPPHIVLYRRPLERRADSRSSLKHLVACRFVEQLSVLTGRSIHDLAGDDFDLDY